MGDLYKLGQSQQGNLQTVGEEIRLDVSLAVDPFLNTGSVTGGITNPGGEVVEGVLIKVLDDEHNPLYHILTDAKGEYAINGISPGSAYHLAAVKDGYLLNEITTFVIAAGQTIEIDGVITPDPNAALSTIAVHVFDNEGDPIEGVVATLLKIEGEVEVPVSITSTNEFGQCVFMNVELGSYIARGTKQGYEQAFIEIQVTASGSIININGTITESQTESKGTINGIITDAKGNPIAEAVVILYEVSGTPEVPILTPVRYTRTTTTGAYLFGEVVQGNYIVKSNKES